MCGLHICLFFLLTCFSQEALASEIIHGKKVPDNLMLYMASVQNNNGHICGGFLVSEDVVVTAAHCNKHKPSSVVLGNHNLKKARNGTERYDVIKRCVHPDYVKVSKGNDIMLLRLAKKPQLGNRIQPVQLPKNKNDVKDKSKCRVAGWGKTKTGGHTIDVLQSVELPVIDLKVCSTQWKELKINLPANVICAGGYGTNKGFCQGDSGGPLVCGGTAVGVVSFNMGGNCDYPNVPNVYTDVSKYLPWIKEILKKKNFNKALCGVLS
ncbi:duodenase-1-like [Solea solea]|uniref:duodenase-1-like n=1 Tax=Solea solea TaxID=90069 RepID=UPI00272AB939|nr:duodenase-1-like [Solea solea]